MFICGTGSDGSQKLIASESEMLAMLDSARKVVLLEPLYKRRYPPLGLAKIATYVKDRGGEVVFQRRYSPVDEDLVCVTSLFTYESEAVRQALVSVLSAGMLFGKQPKILVGGVFASLMPEVILGWFPHFPVYVFVGYSKWLDMVKPDYSLDYGVEKKWTNFSYAFTTRGCPNRCGYCAVHKLEPDVWVNPKWADVVDVSKPYVMFSDNNLTAQSLEHLKAVSDFLNRYHLKVIFDNGFDCKYITDEVAKVLATMPFCTHGLRMSFDRISEDGVFQTAVKRLLDAGVAKEKLMCFCLFNFEDTPREALYRLETANKLGMRPYPQRYTPLNITGKKPYVGKYWSKNLLQAFRYFWLMRGENLHGNFLEWVKHQERFKLCDEDFALLDFNVAGGIVG